MADRYAVMDGNSFTGVVIPRPRSYAGTSFGANAGEDTYRNVGLWPVQVDDPGAPSEWHVHSETTTEVDIANQVLIEHISYEKMPLEDVREGRIAEIEAKHEAILNGGFDYDFGGKTATLEDGTTETAGVRTLQTRPQDRERWATTNQVAAQFIGAGQPNEPLRPFRTQDNARVPMTAQEANDCLNAMQVKFGAALETMWDHKDAVRQLTDVDSVIAYDITTDWP